MPRVFLPAFLLSVLFLTGCLRGCGTASPSPGEGTESQASSLIEEEREAGMDEGSITEEVSSSSTQVVDELSSEGEAASSLAEKLETPKFVMDALQWAQDYRIAFSAIAKLLAIAEGRYVLQEGEDPPNLHGAYEQLHANLGSLDIPEDDTDLQKMAEELDAELGEIIAKLSVPPTTSELTVANEEREVLRSQIDAFYQRIQFERNSS